MEKKNLGDFLDFYGFKNDENFYVLLVQGDNSILFTGRTSREEIRDLIKCEVIEVKTVTDRQMKTYLSFYVNLISKIFGPF